MWHARGRIIHISLLVGNPKRRRPLGGSRHMWEDNNKMCLGEIGWCDMQWIDWAQDEDQWTPLVDTVKNLWVP
jgi:hypothetical protein